jgi:hypothetical protein
MLEVRGWAQDGFLAANAETAKEAFALMAADASRSLSSREQWHLKNKQFEPAAEVPAGPNDP